MHALARISRSAALFVLALAGARSARAQDSEPKSAPSPFAPMVAVQQDDYARARKAFRTKLLREAPSPQTESLPSPPAGVDVVEYVSGALRLKAWVSRPARAGEKHPAVLFLHGGFAFGIDDWEASRPYRDAGWVVLTPMLRGENGQPGSFSFFYDEVDDALAAAECLARLPYVDADRLYLAGPSAGGTVALLAAMTSKRFRAAASFSATPDQVLFCKHSKNASRDIPIDVGNVRELEMRSPLAFAASLKCPTRLYWGSLEPEWTETSRRLAVLAKQAGLDVEAMQVEGDHQSSVRPGVERSLEFFRAH
jgi:dipeptidyl aminopeptidase/acylaminoacyl peptidase